MLSFKGTHFPKDVILYAVFFYVRYGVSYRDLEEIMEERGVEVDHATLNRWVIRYSPAIAVKAKSQKRETNGSVAIIIKSADLLVFRHNYPAKAINCL